MTVRLGPDGVIELVGACPSEDAEPLLQHLTEAPGAIVDWRACDGAHTAVVQVLMAARTRPRGPPRSALLTQWVEPLLPSR
jgi:hypothetical protein